MATGFFMEGLEARKAGKLITDNPYIVGYTKLGNPKLSDAGVEWDNGFNWQGRTATNAEVAEASRLTNVSQFRRKSNKFYR